jgi:hypothetical protein
LPLFTQSFVGAARLATLLAPKDLAATASGLHSRCREIVASFDGLREMAAMGHVPALRSTEANGRCGGRLPSFVRVFF